MRYNLLSCLTIGGCFAALGLLFGLALLLAPFALKLLPVATHLMGGGHEYLSRA
jgi:hypothetical protein